MSGQVKMEYCQLASSASVQSHVDRMSTVESQQLGIAALKLPFWTTHRGVVSAYVDMTLFTESPHLDKGVRSYAQAPECKYGTRWSYFSDVEPLSGPRHLKCKESHTTLEGSVKKKKKKKKSRDRGIFRGHYRP